MQVKAMILYTYSIYMYIKLHSHHLLLPSLVKVHVYCLVEIVWHGFCLKRCVSHCGWCVAAADKIHISIAVCIMCMIMKFHDVDACR